MQASVNGIIFKILKEKTKYQPRILYPAKIFLKNKSKIKIFSIQTSFDNLCLGNVHHKKCANSGNLIEY